MSLDGFGWLAQLSGDAQAAVLVLVDAGWRAEAHLAARLGENGVDGSVQVVLWSPRLERSGG